MEKSLYLVKANLALALTVVTNALGGNDTVLSLLVSLILADLLTGTLYAIMTKKLSSTEMRNGIIRKMLIFVVIYIAFNVDKVIIDAIGSPITLWGKSCYVRTIFIVYACIEEGISLLENLSNIGVPTPTWLKDILVQVSNCTNKSTPKEIVNLVRKLFGVDIVSGLTKEEDKNNKTSDTKDNKSIEDKENNTDNKK